MPSCVYEVGSDFVKYFTNEMLLVLVSGNHTYQGKRLTGILNQLSDLGVAHPVVHEGDSLQAIGGEICVLSKQQVGSIVDAAPIDCGCPVAVTEKSSCSTSLLVSFNNTVCV